MLWNYTNPCIEGSESCRAHSFAIQFRLYWVSAIHMLHPSAMDRKLTGTQKTNRLDKFQSRWSASHQLSTQFCGQSEHFVDLVEKAWPLLLIDSLCPLR